MRITLDENEGIALGNMWTSGRDIVRMRRQAYLGPKRPPRWTALTSEILEVAVSRDDDVVAARMGYRWRRVAAVDCEQGVCKVKDSRGATTNVAAARLHLRIGSGERREEAGGHG
jgi:hypothetical protein